MKVSSNKIQICVLNRSDSGFTLYIILLLRRKSCLKYLLTPQISRYVYIFIYKYILIFFSNIIFSYLLYFRIIYCYVRDISCCHFCTHHAYKQYRMYICMHINVHKYYSVFVYICSLYISMRISWCMNIDLFLYVYVINPLQE